MKKRKILLSSFLLLLTVIQDGFSQKRKCAVGGTELEFKRIQSLQKVIDSYESSGTRKGRRNNEVVTIPVVVHIVHSNNSGEIGGEQSGNISDEQIISQIKVLNNDFRRVNNTLGYNENPDGADMEINFALAKTTPDGLPTNGILRVYNSRRSFDVFNDNELLSSLSYWDSERYLNIWVTTLSDNYIGYAEFPTGDFNGLDFDPTNPRTDGIIIDHTVFGNRTGTASSGIYSYGRTLTHEVGHWLGLIHTWGDSFCGTDYCEDTPSVSGPNDTSQCEANASRCNGVSRIPMIENYLDYTPDSCMNTFTQDQKTRVNTIFEISQRRNRLLKAAKIAFVPVSEPTLTIINNPATNSNLTISVSLPDFQDFQISLYSLSGKLISSKEYVDFPGALIPVSELTQAKGAYFVKLTTNSSTATKKIIIL